MNKETMFDRKFRIKMDILNESLVKIKSRDIKLQGGKFCTNLKNVDSMLILPVEFLTILNLERSIVFYETKARMLTTLRESSEIDIQSQYEKELDRIIKSEFTPDQEEIIKAATESGIKDFVKKARQ